jgi:cobalamin biosynthesis Mg chelatase CobN
MSGPSHTSLRYNPFTRMVLSLRKCSISDEAAPRIFGALEWSEGMGVNLAVHASAWEGVEDLAEVFIYWNRVAYGRDRFGDEARAGLVSRLSTVDLTSIKPSPMNMTCPDAAFPSAPTGGITAVLRPGCTGRKGEGRSGRSPAEQI